ncbi:MAG: PH domain-containing protein [Chloroflexi bacterium]|nr:PH domain-containing protein [Chloroflexota bacterium]
MSTLTQEGIDALKLGNKSKALVLLKQAIAQNPQDVKAWLWLSGAVENDQERLKCLQKVIAIDPKNTVAANGLAKLIAKGVVQIQTPIEETPLNASDNSNNLAPQSQKRSSEKLIFKEKPSIAPFVIALILITFLLVGAIWMVTKASNSSSMNLVLGLFILVGFGSFYWKIGIAFLKSLFARYTLTTKHLIIRTGVLSKSEKTIPIHKIQDVSFQQVFLLRPFGVGNVLVESAGERGEMKLFALADCQKRSRQILQVVERYH